MTCSPKLSPDTISRAKSPQNPIIAKRPVIISRLYNSLVVFLVRGKSVHRGLSSDTLLCSDTLNVVPDTCLAAEKCDGGTWKA